MTASFIQNLHNEAETVNVRMIVNLVGHCTRLSNGGTQPLDLIQKPICSGYCDSHCTPVSNDVVAIDLTWLGRGNKRRFCAVYLRPIAFLAGMVAPLLILRQTGVHGPYNFETAGFGLTVCIF
jgi:hypothetical protein